jgi:hypothetical protein
MMPAHSDHNNEDAESSSEALEVSVHMHAPASLPFAAYWMPVPNLPCTKPVLRTIVNSQVQTIECTTASIECSADMWHVCIQSLLVAGIVISSVVVVASHEEPKITVDRLRRQKRLETKLQQSEKLIDDLATATAVRHGEKPRDPVAAYCHGNHYAHYLQISKKIHDSVTHDSWFKFNRLRRVPPASMERAILQAANSPCRGPARTWLLCKTWCL